MLNLLHTGALLLMVARIHLLAPSVSRAGVRRSQNGFDNSGHASNVTWAADGRSFTHWPTRSAGWQGAFDPYTMTYSVINWNNIRATVQATLMTRMGHSRSVTGH